MTKTHFDVFPEATGLHRRSGASADRDHASSGAKHSSNTGAGKRDTGAEAARAGRDSIRNQVGRQTPESPRRSKNS